MLYPGVSSKYFERTSSHKTGRGSKLKGVKEGSYAMRTRIVKEVSLAQILEKALFKYFNDKYLLVSLHDMDLEKRTFLEIASQTATHFLVLYLIEIFAEQQNKMFPFSTLQNMEHHEWTRKLLQKRNQLNNK
jgi:hypothetical protein